MRAKCRRCGQSGTCYFIPEATRSIIIPNRRRYPPPGPPMRVRDLDPDGTRLMLHCRHPGCGKRHDFTDDEVRAFMARYHPETIFYDILKRMRCTKCGHKEIAAIGSPKNVPPPPFRG